MAAPGFLGRHDNICLYIPNIIGYLRILASAIAFGYALSNPWITVGFYFAGFVCDELDGRFARMFNQTSTFGSVLDMVTDRLSTAGLLLILALLYPAYYQAALGLMVLDIFSHWFQMYASLVDGGSTHKDTDSRSWLVRVYYRHRIFMGYCCVSCEVLYLTAYMLHWQKDTLLQRVIFFPMPDGFLSIPWYAALSIPGFIVKQVCNFEQIKVAVQCLIRLDLAKGKKASKKQ